MGPLEHHRQAEEIWASLPPGLRADLLEILISFAGIFVMFYLGW